MRITGFARGGIVVGLLWLLQSVVNAGVVLSEFRTRGPAGAADEFVELYNNSDGAVDISGWTIKGSNSSGSTSTRLTVNAGTMIPARGHFLATNSSAGGYSGPVAGNQTYTTGITDDGGIALVMPDGITILDQVGMSAGSAYKEGTTLTPLTTNTDQSYERKPGGAAGSTQDTNDNASDFQVRAGSDPQNLSSPPTPNNAAPGVVTTTNDSGAGSLRQTLADAVDGDTITFSLSYPATITLSSGELVVDKNLTIAGPGANVLTVNANGTSRVFHISPNKTVTIAGLTITGGRNLVGGIYNDQGTLTLSNSTVTNNFGVDGTPGGINNTGTLTVNNSTVRNNISDDDFSGVYGARGGGISNAGTLTINNSTISGNQAISCCMGTTGGGIQNGGTATLNNSTVSGNSAVSGASIYNTGTITVKNSTVNAASNEAGSGASINNSAAAATLEIGNTILSSSGTISNLSNSSGTVVSDGYNLSNDNGGGFLTATGDQINTDPKLDPNGLQNNGGPTRTIGLQSTSPAINSGDPNASAQDQRYYLRNGAPDKGAFEFAGTLAPIGAASRETHGSVGTFNVNLPLTGNVGIECRSGGPTNDYKLVLTFAASVSVNGTPQAQVTSGIGQVGSGGVANGGVVSIDQTGTIVTVPLTNVSNAQRIAVTLFNVSDGTNSNNVIVSMGVLIGDTNADTFVDAIDTAQTKSKSGQGLNTTNFREDINVDGFLDAIDVAFVKSKSGTTLASTIISPLDQPTPKPLSRRLHEKGSLNSRR